MPELHQPPTGTATFLFTDIEGSPRLWELDPAAMRAAHSRYQEILYDAIEANGGYAFQTIGEAVQAAFPNAVQAVQAAIDAQFLLCTEQWPPSLGDLDVRMAVHTGLTEQVPNGQSELGGSSAYFGSSLNKVTSLLSAGHDGQMLLSAASQELVRDHLSQLQPSCFFYKGLEGRVATIIRHTS